jgi:hypothetical protein
MNPATIPGILMGALSALCLLLFLFGFHKAAGRSEGPLKGRRMTLIASAIALGWVALIGLLAGNGLFRDVTQLPPRPVLAMLAWLPVVIGLTYTKAFKRLALSTPPQGLIYFQSFRIAVELLLFQAFVRGLMPVQMTFEGRNFDIVAGILALIVGFIVAKRFRGWRTVATIYNYIGLALLVNVLVIALLSMPTPLRYFMNEPAITIVGQFPFIYLPTVLVVFAYSFHILSLRQLYLLRRARDSGEAAEPTGRTQVIKAGQYTKRTE